MNIVIQKGFMHAFLVQLKVAKSILLPQQFLICGNLGISYYKDFAPFYSLYYSRSIGQCIVKEKRIIDYSHITQIILQNIIA